MRALLTILCLFCTAPAERVGDDFEGARRAKAAEYRAIIAEIAPEPNTASPPPALGLPAPLERALQVWTEA